ncbi:MAG: hypothetical protein R3B84_22380 [Zavarzinella sp.]
MEQNRIVSTLATLLNRGSSGGEVLPMGMRWRAVLTRATDAEAREIAVAAQQLIPSLTNKIDASVVSERSPAVPAPWLVLQMFNFQSRRPEFCNMPTCIGEAFSDSVFQTSPASDALKEIAKEPHVALAILASRILGEATFVICSDTLCCSGYLRFTNGDFVTGEIYGWEGNSSLWSMSRNSYREEEIELTDEGDYDYYKPVVDGLIETIGPGADELFLSPIGGGAEGECLRYQILAKRELITPVVAINENAEDTVNATPIDSVAKAKRPWWKFW